MNKILITDPNTDRKALNDFMSEMISRLLNENKEKGQKIDLCGKAKNWDECFNGFQNQDGSIFICLHYNIGKYTYAISDTFNKN